MADKIKLQSKYDMQGNYEMSDSGDEYTEKEKQLLQNFQGNDDYQSSSEDEVYGFSDNESNKSDLGMADSDVEGQEKSDDDLPDSKAWGKKKRAYYSTDYVDEDYGGFGDDEEAALMEEQEAKNIQKRLIEQLEEEDFKLDFLTPQVSAEDEGKESVIKSDLSQMSKREKLQILEKESPEFAGLVDDFKSKLTVAKDDLHPVLQLVNGGKLPECAASKFIKTNYDLILNYCTNISFYLLLKSQKINIQNHPVVKRLYQYRQILIKLEPIYLEVIKPQIDKIMNAFKNNIKLNILKNQSLKRKSGKHTPELPSKKLKLINALEKDEGEDTGVSDDEGGDNIENDYFKADNLESRNLNESDESGFSDNDGDDSGVPGKPKDQISLQELGEKRQITYQIAKNKGLTPYRKKEQRNPRVKHKLKYRKAKIRRKGAIREPRTEVTRYAGESSGIKANVKKGIKIK
ncbi:something about silencing protein 10 [Leptidea sinapis]|uniref:something about silencing protein 10 n=1 Tax=Leptidea sinapis TaxID=189913 RepID=UPI00213F7DDD|nr:something about silencing protein 10 [Leptidea sinapis]